MKLCALIVSTITACVPVLASGSSAGEEAGRPKALVQVEGESKPTIQKKFEYKIHRETPGENVERTLNGLGDEGWELVAVETQYNSDGGSIGRSFFMKRSKTTKVKE